MTSVQAIYEGPEGLYGLEVRGHAEGKPTVCSAVSGLVYALAGWLENHPECATLKRELKPGKAWLLFRGGSEARAAMDTAVIGLAQIAEAEPEEVSVEVKKAF